MCYNRNEEEVRDKQKKREDESGNDHGGIVACGWWGQGVNWIFFY